MRFHRFLDGETENGESIGAPDEWIIGRVCEAYGCLPEAAIEAIENDVGGLIFTIMELRSYAETKHEYDSTPMDKRRKSSMMDKVSEIRVAIANEKIRLSKEEEK